MQLSGGAHTDTLQLQLLLGAHPSPQTKQHHPALTQASRPTLKVHLPSQDPWLVSSISLWGLARKTKRHLRPTDKHRIRCTHMLTGT